MTEHPGGGSADRPLRVAALLTTHERVATSLACLAALEAQQLPAEDVDVHVVVADAGSTDGTADEIRRRHPRADVLDVGSDVFWNRGMYLAWRRAQGRGYDAYLWLNDDTMLEPHALACLLATWRSVTGPAIVVGTTADPSSGELTYGGVVRPDRMRPLHYELVPPGEEPESAESMNGNCVLVPQEVVEAVGILDAAFVHGMGDYDYGHRAKAGGCAIWVAPAVVGTCPRNPPRTWEGARDRWRQLRRPTGLPPRDFARFARRWAGPLWPLYWASPYVRRLVRAAVGRD